MADPEENRTNLLQEKRKRLEGLKLKNAIKPVPTPPTQTISPPCYDKGVQTVPPPLVQPGPKTPTSLQPSSPACAIEKERQGGIEGTCVTAFLVQATRSMEEALSTSVHERFKLPPTCFATIDDSEALGVDTVHVQSCKLRHDGTFGHPISCLDWSPIQSELLLSCSRPAGAGLVLWDVHAPLTRVQGTDNVVIARFHENVPHLIVSGSSDGSVAICDTRIPGIVQQSGVSASSHTCPIISLLPGSSVQSFLSMSSDGLLCDWDFAKISQPRKTYRLPASLPTCAAPSFASSCYFVGCEDGSLLMRTLSSIEAGDSASFPCHANFLTRVAVMKNLDIDIVATASIDWGLRIWLAGSNSELAPLLLFDTSATVTDVDWSPAQSCVLATADCAGSLRFFPFIA